MKTNKTIWVLSLSGNMITQESVDDGDFVLVWSDECKLNSYLENVDGKCQAIGLHAYEFSNLLSLLDEKQTDIAINPVYSNAYFVVSAERLMDDISS